MKFTQELRLHFLGRRAYLHGTTLFDSLAPQCQGGHSISFRISRLIVSDRVIIEAYDPNGAATTSRFNATLVWKKDGAFKGLGVTACPQSQNPERLPFDEAAIVSRGYFSGTEVTTQTQVEDSFSRNLVALNKALISRNFNPPEPGQWLFVRLDIERYVDRFHSLALKQRGNVGFTAVSSVIEVDGQGLGTVVFSWIKK